MEDMCCCARRKTSTRALVRLEVRIAETPPGCDVSVIVDSVCTLLGMKRMAAFSDVSDKLCASGT